MTAYKQSESIQWLNRQYANNSKKDGATYNVFQLPVEAPNFGGRTLINSSAHSIASPFGWHDTDGQAGPEYTDTRGNNVTAFNDKESDGLMWLYYGGNYQFSGFAEGRSEEHTSELQSRGHLVCRLLLEKKKAQ